MKRWILVLLALLCLTEQGEAGFTGETFPTLAVATADTSEAYDISLLPPVAVGLQANCDSLQVTVQISLDSSVWLSVAGTTWPVLIDGTAGSVVLHFLRSIGQAPPDGSVSSDFGLTTIPAPYMRVILNNNDSATTVQSAKLRIMWAE